MTGKSLLALVLSLFTFTGILAPLPQASAKHAKKYTITDRQQTLKKEIAEGEKSEELTAKEAQSLNEEEAGIEAKELKMKAKNNGSLTYADQNKIEKELNKLSVRIQKLKLDKRVRK